MGLTVGELARRFKLSEWQVRRAVDALDAEIPRVGLYRLVPLELLGALKAEMRRRGYLRRETANAG